MKENHFYSDIIPALKYFQQISNVAEAERIDAFILCPGSRISLNPSTNDETHYESECIWLIQIITDAKVADADAVLLLENTKLLNYINENRQIGFDSEATLAILKVCGIWNGLFQWPCPIYSTHDLTFRLWHKFTRFASRWGAYNRNFSIQKSILICKQLIWIQMMTPDWPM